MNLKQSEKKALFRFLGIYITATFLVISTLSYLQYRIKLESLKEHILSHLRLQAFQIVSSAIDAQMKGTKFRLPKNVSFELLDSTQNYIKGDFKEKVDIEKEYDYKNGCLYYIDKSAKGHMGIAYVVVRDCSFQEKRDQILFKTLGMAAIYFLFLSIVGWFLGRLFLEPMRKSLENLDKFIKDSTHELNTPVTTLLLATEKLLYAKNPKRYISTIKMSAKLISSIHQDLTYTTLEHNKEPQLSTLDVSKIIDENIAFFDVLIEQKKLHIQTDLAPCTIVADEEEIRILIKNLIDNAIKYAFANSAITIALVDCSLRISNYARPIPKEKLKEIFERFTRADDTQGGYGIGLHIVKGICQKYGFTIQVESKEKTTFILNFSQKGRRDS